MRVEATDLSGIALRRAVYEALGWKHAKNCPLGPEPDAEAKQGWLCHWLDADGMLTVLPAVETSSDIALALLDEVCRGAGLLWEVGNTVTPDTPRAAYCSTKTTDPDDATEGVWHGSTPAEVIALAIVAVLEGAKAK